MVGFFLLNLHGTFHVVVTETMVVQISTFCYSHIGWIGIRVSKAEMLIQTTGLFYGYFVKITEPEAERIVVTAGRSAVFATSWIVYFKVKFFKRTVLY